VSIGQRNFLTQEYYKFKPTLVFGSAKNTIDL